MFLNKKKIQSDLVKKYYSISLNKKKKQKKIGKKFKLLSVCSISRIINSFILGYSNKIKNTVFF